MVPRQTWLFQLGCWMAIATALLRVAAHVAGPELNALSREIAGAFAPTHVWTVPGLRQPTFLGVLDAFSLSVAMSLATIGAAGLVVLRYGAGAPLVARGVARVFAIGTAMLLAISIADAFSLETFFLAVVAMCFGLASVTPDDI
jgi:hypothetical protein